MHFFRDLIFLALFILFLVVGLILLAVFHLAGGFHVLLALAVLFLIVHFVRQRRRTV